MEVAEVKVEEAWAKVVELEHPLADFLIAYAPSLNMAIVIEYAHGVPYGHIYAGKVTLLAETLSTLVEAKRRRKAAEDLCIVRRDGNTYIYLPERRYFAKFNNGELEYDIPNTSNYRNDIYPLEDVAVVESVKEICEQ